MEAILKLYGDIGMSEDGESGITASTVVEFLERNAAADSLTVKINSRGGDVTEGWTIHDLLVNSGKRIKTVGEGKIYSIATIIFLAGSEREIMKNADGLIHNPFIPPYTLADQYESGDLMKIAESLKQEEAKILDFYVERTGAAKDRLAEYMKEDTKLSAEDMFSLGFATKIIEPVRAFAYINHNYKTCKMDESDVKTFGQKLDAILDKIKNFSQLAPIDQTITDKEGKEFKLEKESGSPAVGDKASPDGTYTLSDGKVIVIENGAVSKINEGEVEETELDKLKRENAELKDKMAALESEKPDLEAAQEALKVKEAAAVALYTELDGMRNSWRPDARGKFGTGDKVGSVDLARVKELNDKLNKKSE